MLARKNGITDPEVPEQCVGEPELRPGVQPSARTAQPLAVEEMSPSEVEAQTRGLEQRDGLAIEWLSVVI